MKSPSDKLKPLTANIKKIIWFLGLHAFSLILFLVFIDIILGSFVFYNYVFLAKQEKPNTTENILKFNERTYQDVMKKLQTRDISNQVSTPSAGVNNQ